MLKFFKDNTEYTLITLLILVVGLIAWVIYMQVQILDNSSELDEMSRQLREHGNKTDSLKNDISAHSSQILKSQDENPLSMTIKNGERGFSLDTPMKLSQFKKNKENDAKLTKTINLPNQIDSLYIEFDGDEGDSFDFSNLITANIKVYGILKTKSRTLLNQYTGLDTFFNQIYLFDKTECQMTFAQFNMFRNFTGWDTVNNEETKIEKDQIYVIGTTCHERLDFKIVNTHSKMQNVTILVNSEVKTIDTEHLQTSKLSILLKDESPDVESGPLKICNVAKNLDTSFLQRNIKLFADSESNNGKDYPFTGKFNQAKTISTEGYTEFHSSITGYTNKFEDANVLRIIHMKKDETCDVDFKKEEEVHFFVHDTCAFGIDFKPPSKKMRILGSDSSQVKTVTIGTRLGCNVDCDENIVLSLSSNNVDSETMLNAKEVQIKYTDTDKAVKFGSKFVCTKLVFESTDNTKKVISGNLTEVNTLDLKNLEDITVELTTLPGNIITNNTTHITVKNTDKENKIYEEVLNKIETCRKLTLILKDMDKQFGINTMDIEGLTELHLELQNHSELTVDIETGVTFLYLTKELEDGKITINSEHIKQVRYRTNTTDDFNTIIDAGKDDVHVKLNE